MNKNFLLSFSSSKHKFPLDNINNECLQFKDFLFEDSQKSNNNSRSSELSNSFVFNNKPRNKWRQVGQNENSERQNAVEANGNDTLSFLRGDKLNTSEVAAFVKGITTRNESNYYNNLELIDDTMQQASSEGSIYQNDINDTMNKTNLIDNRTDNESSNEIYKNSYNEAVQINYNRNPQIHLIPQRVSPLIVPHPHLPQMFPVPMTLKFEPVKIENLILFNNRINFPNDQPLWYVCSPWQATLGPLSSKQLTDMYNRKQLDGNFDFRPIDIFNFLNIKSTKNEFTKLKIINNEDWHENIKDSHLLQFTELYLTSKKLLEVSEKKINTQSRQKNKDIGVNNYKINPLENDTLQITQNAFQRNSDEIENFMSDAIVQSAKNDFTNIIDFSKVAEAETSEWEKVDKKKKKLKENDSSFYLVGNKPKNEEHKKELKLNYKVDIVPPEELAKQLSQKHKKEENKPKFEVFVVDNNLEKQANSKKKIKGKPQDLNIKLGFKF